MMKPFRYLFAFSVASMLLLPGLPVQAAQDKDVIVINDSSDPVPVTVQGEVGTTQRLPIAESGTWQGGGLSLPEMIVHDLVFFNTNYPLCSISINFVIDQFNSRVLNIAAMGLEESVEFHYEAGIDSTNLRFGTVTPVNQDPNACIINWAAMGFAVEF
jgi:hypothetical protein